MVQLVSVDLDSDLFIETALIVPCILENRSEIQTRFLLDISATGIAFIEKMARNVCHILKILFILLAKLKPLKIFNERSAQPIIHEIYFILTIQSYSKLLVFMLIISLGQHFISLSKS